MHSHIFIHFSILYIIQGTKKAKIMMIFALILLNQKIHSYKYFVDFLCISLWVTHSH